MKVNNDPNLKQQEKIGKILDHHPHMAFPPHGTIRKGPAHMMKKIRNPRKHAD